MKLIYIAVSLAVAMLVMVSMKEEIAYWGATEGSSRENINDKGNSVCLRGDAVLFTMLVETFLIEELQNTTIFIPDDNAIRKYLLESDGVIGSAEAMLAAHVVDGNIRPGDLDNGDVLHTRGGTEIWVHRAEDGEIALNGWAIVQEFCASNKSDLYLIDSTLPLGS